MLQDLRAGALDSKCSLGLLKLHRLVRIRSVVQLDRLMTARRPLLPLSTACCEDSYAAVRGRRQPRAGKRQRSPALVLIFDEGTARRPGKPTDNAAVESFNGRLRQECLNAHWFLSLADAQEKITAWREDYNESRPHSALDWARPAEFARRCGLQAATANPEEPEISTSEWY